MFTIYFYLPSCARHDTMTSDNVSGLLDLADVKLDKMPYDSFYECWDNETGRCLMIKERRVK